MRPRKQRPQIPGTTTQLTPHDMDFIKGYMRLKDGAATLRELHPHWKPTTCAREASRYFKKPAIIAALNKIEEDARRKVTCTLADHLTVLAEIRADAFKKGKHHEAINAEELRGKAAGLYRIDVHLHQRLTAEVVKGMDLQDFTDDELAKIRAGEITESLFARLATGATSNTGSD